MLTETYIEALLVDEEQADQVWEAWDAGEIDDSAVAWYWVYICITHQTLAAIELNRYTTHAAEQLRNVTSIHPSCIACPRS